jgi:hypothetical protein
MERAGIFHHVAYPVPILIGMKGGCDGQVGCTGSDRTIPPVPDAVRIGSPVKGGSGIRGGRKGNLHVRITITAVGPAIDPGRRTGDAAASVSGDGYVQHMNSGSIEVIALV